MTQANVGRLSEQSKKAATTVGSASSAVTGSTGQPKTAPASAPAPVNPALQLQPAPAKRAASSQYTLQPQAGTALAAAGAATQTAWVETPLVGPGETLPVDLRVALVKQAGKQETAAVRISARAAGQDGTPPLVEQVAIPLRGKRRK